MTTSLEVIHLGMEDTDRDILKKKREMEDNELDWKFGSHNLVRFLAEKTKLKKQRALEDEESFKRKKRRAELKMKLKNRESQKIEVIDDDGNQKEQSKIE